jgi:hypothetical protein
MGTYYLGLHSTNHQKLHLSQKIIERITVVVATLLKDEAKILFKNLETLMHHLFLWGEPIYVKSP